MTAGIGVKFGLGFEASAFTGTKFGIQSGVTMGVSGEASTKFTVYSDNLSRVAHSLYFRAYLKIMNEGITSKIWDTYFRNLEDNEALFLKADKLIDEYLAQCFQRHQMTFLQQQKFEQLRVLSAFKATGQLPPRVVAIRTRPRSRGGPPPRPH